jgi:hypothetical protein
VTDLLQRVTLAPAPIRAVRPFLARFALSIPAVRRTLRRRIAGISIAYPAPRDRKEHPWNGQRVPDVSIGASRLYLGMRRGNFTLFDLFVTVQQAAEAEPDPERRTKLSQTVEPS